MPNAAPRLTSVPCRVYYMNVIKIKNMRTVKGGTAAMGRRAKVEDAGPVRVVAYLRVSTAGQERHGLGLGAQEEAIRDYCKARGWAVSGVHKDVISGAAADEEDLSLPRPGFERLLAEANGSSGVRYVVVYATDRLWRGDLARVLVQRALKKAGLDVRSVTEARYTIYRQEPADALVGAVLEGVAAYERMVITARMTRGRLHKARQGGYAGGQPPYGYRAERGSKVLAVHDEEARTVRRIFALRRRGLSPYRIADALNREGRPARQGGTWTARLIYNIVKRKPFYEGRVYEYAGVRAAPQAPAIL